MFYEQWEDSPPLSFFLCGSFAVLQELEKSVDCAALKAQNTALARRLRRGQDRYRTQPITSEEVVIAAT